MTCILVVLFVFLRVALSVSLFRVTDINNKDLPQSSFCTTAFQYHTFHEESKGENLLKKEVVILIFISNKIPKIFSFRMHVSRTNQCVKLGICSSVSFLVVLHLGCNSF